MPDAASLLTFAYHYLGARWRYTRLGGDELTAFQDRRARGQVVRAVHDSPYYRERFAGHDLSDWRTLPTTDKRAMMADFGAFNTRNVPGNVAMAVALEAERTRDFRPLVPNTDLSVGLSTGTSGHRGLFLVSPREQATWAGALLARALPGRGLFEPGGWRVALFHRASSNLYERLEGRRLRFRYFDLMTPLQEAIEAIETFQPHILTGPPTLLARLAVAADAGTLRHRPRRIFSVAEVLEPADAAQIAAAFGLAAVDQIYQCTEGLLAVSCSHHHLHLQEDIVVVQTDPLGSNSEEQRQAPILTDLWRQTQPILRYRLGDVLTLAPNNASPCLCGSRYRIIERIEGRADDVCQFPDGDGRLVPVYPDTLRRAVLLAHGGIADYEIVQTRPGQAAAYLALQPDAPAFAVVSAAVSASVATVLEQYRCRADDLSVTLGLPEHPSGTKRRRVRRLPQK